ncbi:MAG: alpha/beta hydrolase [Deltaproteobacteria bacterium]|nr:alpha/beta hydrolase [Deltaproteobacteria bacterium]
MTNAAAACALALQGLMPHENDQAFVHTTVTSTSTAPAGVNLHVVSAGDPGRPLVVLLHGFPEHWGTWRQLMHTLVDAGFAVAAPDLRGYGGSDKPPGIDSYAMDPLIDDVEAIIRAQGREKAHVIAHDWGGVVAWWLAMKRPHLVDKLVIVNSPHPLLMLAKLRKSKRQLLKSSYMLLFASPLAPPLLRMGDHAVVRAMLKATKRKGAYSDDDVEGAVQALRGDGLERALSYYRAMVKGARSTAAAAAASSSSSQKIKAKTLIVWGKDDPVLGLDLVEGIERYVDDVRVVPLERASHWVQHDAPAELAAAVLDHLDPIP